MSTVAADPALATMTLITSFAEVDEVFRSSDFAPGWGLGANAPFRAHTMTALEGDEHFERRRREAVLFRKEALIAYDQDALVPAIARGLATAAAAPDPDGVVRAELIGLVRPMLLAVSSTVAGIDGLDRLDAARTFLADAALMSEGSHVQWSARDQTTVVRDGLAAKQRFAEQFVAPSWQRRQQHAADSLPQRPPDLLALMIREQPYFSRWDADLVVREAMMYVTGGLFSPSNALPHIADAIDRWLFRHPEDRAKLSDLAFLRDAATEGLRLHPPGPPKHRRALRDLTLGSGRRIKRDEHLLLDIAAAGRDPAVFGADAHEFRVPRAATAQPFGMTFGGGPHACIGRGFTVGETWPGAPPGMLVRILEALYAAGMRPDPDRKSERMPGNRQGNYAAYLVRFDGLAR